MPLSEPRERLLLFCKALADENRLKIVGLLSVKPYSVEELAATIGIRSATVSHHLARLLEAGLVDARAQQYYNVYALRAETMRQMAEPLSTEGIRTLASDLDLDAYSNQVLNEYLAQGRLKEIPSQVKKREVILSRLAAEFEPGKRYAEKQVNRILRAFYVDHAALRKELVKSRYLVLEQGFYRRAASR